MGIFKRALPLLLVFALLSGLGIRAGAGGAADNGGAQREAEVLEMIGVKLPDASQGESGLSRGDYISLLLGALGISIQEGAFTNVSSFFDLDQDDPFYPAGMTARMYGLVNGYSDNTLRADQGITAGEAYAALLDAMGYGDLARLRGGYPAGVASAAAEAGVLLKSIPAGGNTLTVSQGLLLLGRALDAPILARVSYGGRGKYQTVKDRTILSEYHGIHKGRGQVGATDSVTVEEKKASPGRVRIEGESYLAGDGVHPALFTGYYTDFYYHLDPAGEKTLKKIFKHARVEELLIAAEDVISYSAGKLYYEDDGGREQFAAIDAGHSLIQNGVRLSAYGPEVFEIEEGTVRLVSNRGDGLYDLVLIDCYTNGLVRNVVKVGNSLVIQFEYQMRNIEIDLSDKNIRFFVEDAQGNGISADRFTGNPPKHKIISIYTDRFERQRGYTVAAADAEYYRIVIGGEPVTGILEGYSQDGGGKWNQAIIDGADYFVSPHNFLEEYGVAVGSKATFAPDHLGKLAAAVPTTQGNEEYRYGYLINAMREKGLGSGLRFKIMAEDGKINLLAGAERFHLNNLIAEGDEALASLRASALLANPAETGYRQLVQYKTNSEGRVQRMQTVLSGIGAPAGTDQDHLRRERAAEKLMVKQSSNWAWSRGVWEARDSGLVLFHKPQVIFQVPEVDTGQDTDYGLAELKDEKHYVIEPYNYSVSRVPRAAVLYGAVTDDKITNFVVMVDRVTAALDDEDSPIQKLYVHDGKAIVGYAAKPDVALGSLKRGDLIEIYGRNEIIAYYQMIMPIDELEDVSTLPANVSTYYKKEYSEVYSVSGRNLLLQRGPLGADGSNTRESQRVFYWTSNTATLTGVIHYDNTDPRNPRVVTGTLEQVKSVYTDGIANATKLFTYENYADPRFVVMYSNVK